MTESEKEEYDPYFKLFVSFAEDIKDILKIHAQDAKIKKLDGAKFASTILNSLVESIVFFLRLSLDEECYPAVLSQITDQLKRELKVEN